MPDAAPVSRRAAMHRAFGIRKGKIWYCIKIDFLFNVSGIPLGNVLYRLNRRHHRRREVANTAGFGASRLASRRSLQSRRAAVAQ
jgi:hypothetical protein